MDKDVEKIIGDNPIMEKILARDQVFWINDYKIPFEEVENLGVRMSDLQDAQERMARFKNFLKYEFEDEIEGFEGIIESDLSRIKKMEKRMKLRGKLYLKEDNNLPIAGSIKARGGIYELLKHTEKLGLEEAIIDETTPYEILSRPENKEFFSNYTIQVGSTGNLGLSIGIMAAKIGYKVVVHMSSDARTWKKDLLREKGVQLIEYTSDYGQAVKQGRALSEKDPKSYFIDDENSMDLFVGYGLGALGLKGQLDQMSIKVDEKNPLFVYLPCGVGGGPGGIAYGLKLLYGDSVHCFFAEPMEAPCMLIGMYTKSYDRYSVQDFGLTNRTIADGLAVGRASPFVSRALVDHLSGIFTVSDQELYAYQYELYDTEKIYLEPSACAGFKGPGQVEDQCGLAYLKSDFKYMKNASHIVWATGGSLVPEGIREKELDKGRKL